MGGADTKLGGRKGNDVSVLAELNRIEKGARHRLSNWHQDARIHVSWHSSDLSFTVFVVLYLRMAECYNPMKTSAAAVRLATPLLLGQTSLAALRESDVLGLIYSLCESPGSRIGSEVICGPC